MTETVLRLALAGGAASLGALAARRSQRLATGIGGVSRAEFEACWLGSAIRLEPPP